MNVIKEVSKQPETGQFIAMWVYNNKIWSSTYYQPDNDCTLLEYNEQSDSFVEAVSNTMLYSTTAKYFIIGELS